MKKLTTVLEENFQQEEQLIEASRADPKQFRILYEKYYKTIFLFIFHKVEQKETAADLTSQTFLKALQNLDKYEFRQLPFSAWLYRIATNETMQYFRNNKKVRKVLIDEALLAELQEPDEPADQEILKNKLIKAIDTQPIADIQLIELRFYEKKSFREIGYILNVTENNAKVKTYRILDKLRKYMY